MYYIDPEILKTIEKYHPDRVYPMYSSLELRQALLELEKGQLLAVVSLELSNPTTPWVRNTPDPDRTQVEYPYLILCEISGEFEPGTKVNSLEAQLSRELFYNDEVVMGKGEDDSLYFHNRPKKSLLVYSGEVVLVRKPNSRSRTPLMTLDGTPCNSIQDYLKKFGLEDTYINRGRVMDWIKATSSGVEVETMQSTCTFCLADFTGYEWKTTKRNNRYAAFLHSKVGVIYGVKDMAKKVSGLTREQAKQVYQKFELPLPSTIYHQIPKSAKVPVPKKPKKRPKRNPEVGKNHTEEQNLSFLVQKYDLKKAKRGVIMTMESGDDMVWKTPEELLAQLRLCGEDITTTQVHELWDTIRGGTGNE